VDIHIRAIIANSTQSQRANVTAHDQALAKSSPPGSSLPQRTVAGLGRGPPSPRRL